MVIPLALIALASVGFLGWYVSQARHDNSPTKTSNATSTTPAPLPPTQQVDTKSTVPITLTDETTGRPIADVTVMFLSDNGLRCESPPCASNKKSWEGSTDKDGVVLVPKTNFQAVNSLHVTGYSGASFPYDANKTSYHMTLKLSPN